MGGRPAQELPPDQEQAIIALLREPTIARAAEASKTPQSTLYRWLKDPAFKAAYREARSEAFRHAVGMVQQCVPHAIQCLLNLVKDAATPAAVKATASGMLIKFGRDSIEIDELAARVEQLEANQPDKEKKRW